MMFRGVYISKVMAHAKRLCDKPPKHRIIKPGIVGPSLKVPDHIQKPDYLSLSQKSSAPIIKSSDEISKIRTSSSIARNVLQVAADSIKPGVSTEQIDLIVHQEIIKLGAYPSPLGYKGFPKSCCTSVNNVVCHGIPDSTILHDGDIINVDVSVYYDGYHGDTSDTFPVGTIGERENELISVTQHCLELAIGICGPGEAFNRIGATIESHALEHGFNICRGFVGHGIGADFHESPHVWHHKNNLTPGLIMQKGMIFTIEPILMDGAAGTRKLSDGWTVVAIDHGLSAQSEHTILITDSGCKVLT